MQKKKVFKVLEEIGDKNAYHYSSKLEVYSPVLTATGQSLEQTGGFLTKKNGQVWSPAKRRRK